MRHGQRARSQGGVSRQTPRSLAGEKQHPAVGVGPLGLGEHDTDDARVPSRFAAERVGDRAGARLEAGPSLGHRVAVEGRHT